MPFPFHFSFRIRESLSPHPFFECVEYMGVWCLFRRIWKESRLGEGGNSSPFILHAFCHSLLPIIPLRGSHADCVKNQRKTNLQTYKYSNMRTVSPNVRIGVKLPREMDGVSPISPVFRNGEPKSATQQRTHRQSAISTISRLLLQFNLVELLSGLRK